MSGGGSSDSAAGGTNLAGLLATQAFSDLTLKLAESDSEVKLHRCVFATSSGFFNKATTSSFAEASSHEIALHEDDLDTLKRMLEYCYTRDYTDGACVGTSIRGQYFAYPWAERSSLPVAPTSGPSTSTSTNAAQSAASRVQLEQDGHITPTIADEVIECHLQMFDIADKYEGVRSPKVCCSEVGQSGEFAIQQWMGLLR